MSGRSGVLKLFTHARYRTIKTVIPIRLEAEKWRERSLQFLSLSPNQDEKTHVVGNRYVVTYERGSDFPAQLERLIKENDLEAEVRGIFGVDELPGWGVLDIECTPRVAERLKALSGFKTVDVGWSYYTTVSKTALETMPGYTELKAR